MRCPNCNIEFTPDPKALAKHLGARGGAKSKRKITAEQQAKMQEARKANREAK